MKQDFSYQCSLCNSAYDADEIQYVCPKDGGNLDVVLDYTGISQQYTKHDILKSPDFSIWRYLPLLPVGEPGGEGTTFRSVGWTPVYRLPGLAKQLGLEQFWLKDEGKNPTASFKDRASAVVVARARQIGAKVVVTASTGNAGAALAGMAAAVGHEAVIFAPKTAPPAKIAQLLIYGARVILVEGNYDQAFDLALEAAQEYGWYCRNTGYNAFTAEGKKTAAFEIWEQVILKLKDIAPSKNPLILFIPVGDGNIISGIHKGFKDLQRLGWLEQMPRIFGVQAEGSSAVANAFFAGTETIIPISAQTIADSISVDLPRDGVRAVRAAVETNGTYIQVKDGDILKAIADLGKVGVFAEPAGATAYAGLLKALTQRLVTPEDPVLVLNTGNGLKDTKAAMQAVKEAPVIEPTLNSLRRTLRNFNIK